MHSWFRKNWFLVGLTLVVVGGVAGANSLQWFADQSWLRNGLVFAVLFVMTLPLKAETIWRVLRSPWPALLASLINLGFIPPLAWLVGGILPAGLSRGLIVAAAAPCTVASAAVWTRKAGGNDAMAIMVTVLTNLSCFVITPAWVWWLAGLEGVQLELMPLVVKLACFVLAPMVLAQICRLQPHVGEFAVRRRIPLATFAQIGLLTMVGIGSIRMGRLFWEEQGALDSLGAIGIMTFLVIGIHLAAFLVGWWSSRWFGFGRPERIAVGFAGSQKTLLVGLSVALEVRASILPMVVYHVSQLFIDTLIANRLASRGEGEAMSPAAPLAASAGQQGATGKGDRSHQKERSDQTERA